MCSAWVFGLMPSSEVHYVAIRFKLNRKRVISFGNTAAAAASGGKKSHHRIEIVIDLSRTSRS